MPNDARGLAGTRASSAMILTKLTGQVPTFLWSDFWLIVA